MTVPAIRCRDGGCANGSVLDEPSIGHINACLEGLS
jgi:hypothetical protein